MKKILLLMVVIAAVTTAKAQLVWKNSFTNAHVSACATPQGVRFVTYHKNDANTKWLFSIYDTTFALVKEREIVVPQQTAATFGISFSANYKAVSMSNVLYNAIQKGKIAFEITFDSPTAERVTFLIDEDGEFMSLHFGECGKIQGSYIYWNTYNKQQGNTPLATISKLNPFYIPTTPATPPTSVSEVGNSRFNVYPNPAEDIIKVTSADRMELVELFNVKGTLTNTIRPNSETVELSVKDMPSGVFYIRVDGLTQKMVKR